MNEEDWRVGFVKFAQISSFFTQRSWPAKLTILPSSGDDFGGGSVLSNFHKSGTETHWS